MEFSNVSLSIVIPTLNRADLLIKTLRLILPQVKQAFSRAEILVCDNASTDNTAEVVKNYQVEYPFLRYHYCPENVQIDQSFQRSAGLCRGEFIWVLGDDDYPAFAAVQRLIKAIDQHPDVSMFHFERLFADPKMQRGWFHFAILDGEEKKLSGSEMWDLVFMRLSFISCFVVRRECWKGDFDFPRYAGFAFMAMIYQKVWQSPCLMLGDPLVVQRASVSAWKASWPQYCLLSMPRVVKLLSSRENCTELISKWRSRYASGYALVYLLIQAKAFGFQKEREKWKEAMSYQNFKNRCIAALITFLMPTVACKLILSYLTHKKKAASGLT